VRLSVEGPDSPAARYCLARYFDELRARFRSRFPIRARHPATSGQLTPPHATRAGDAHGEPVGCGALKCHAGFWPRSSACGSRRRARGLGGSRTGSCITSRTARERTAFLCSDFENQQGADRGPGPSYRRNGFREVPAFNAEPYAHHCFEKDAISAHARDRLGRIGNHAMPELR